MDSASAKIEIWTLPIVSAFNALTGGLFVANGGFSIITIVGVLILATVPLLLWVAYRSYREYRDQRIVIGKDLFQVKMAERVVFEGRLDDIVSLIKFASPVSSPKAVLELRFADGKMFPVGWFYQNHHELAALMERRTGLSFQLRSMVKS